MSDLITEGSLFYTSQDEPTEREKEFFNRLLLLCEEFDMEIEFDHPLVNSRGGSSFHSRTHEWYEVRVMNGKLSARVPSSSIKYTTEIEK